MERVASEANGVTGEMDAIALFSAGIDQLGKKRYTCSQRHLSKVAMLGMGELSSCVRSGVVTFPSIMEAKSLLSCCKSKEGGDRRGGRAIKGGVGALGGYTADGYLQKQPHETSDVL